MQAECLTERRPRRHKCRFADRSMLRDDVAGRRARTERCAPDVRRDTKAFALNLLGRRARVLEEAREACEAALRLCAAGLAGAAADVARCGGAEAGRALRSMAAKAAAQPRKCTEKIKRCHMERMGVFWAHTMGAENWIRKRKQGKFLRSVMKQLKISNIKNLGRLSKLTSQNLFTLCHKRLEGLEDEARGTGA